MDAIEEVIEEAAEEAVEEVELQSHSAAELGSDSPAPIPSVPSGTMHKRPMGVLPAEEVSVSAEEKPRMGESLAPESTDPDSSRKDRSAIDRSVDEMGMQQQSSPGPGSDSPAPVPSATLFTAAGGVQVTRVTPLCYTGSGSRMGADICLTLQDEVVATTLSPPAGAPYTESGLLFQCGLSQSFGHYFHCGLL